MLPEKMTLLRKKFSDSALTAETMLDRILKGLTHLDPDFFQTMTRLEDQMNQFEIELDFYCTSIISLYAPEAKDLRTVLMVLKMNHDIERTGDLLFGIAKALKHLSEQGEKADPELSMLMADAAEMVRGVIRAFLDEDVVKAESILSQDEVVDSRRHAIISRMLTTISKDPDHVSRYYDSIKIAQKIERIGDHATNMAEDIIYMVKARTIKHHGGDHPDGVGPTPA